MRLMATIVSLAALAIPSAALAYSDSGASAENEKRAQLSYIAATYGMGVAKAE